MHQDASEWTRVHQAAPGCTHGGGLSGHVAPYDFPGQRGGLGGHVDPSWMSKRPCGLLRLPQGLESSAVECASGDQTIQDVETVTALSEDEPLPGRYRHIVVF